MAAKDVLKELDISTLLMANRAYIQSAVQIMGALSETLLNPDELIIYENVLEADQD